MPGAPSFKARPAQCLPSPSLPSNPPQVIPLLDLAIEFYSKDVWSRLDCDWQRFLDSQGRHNVVQLLDKDASDFPVRSFQASYKQLHY